VHKEARVAYIRVTEAGEVEQFDGIPSLDDMYEKLACDTVEVVALTRDGHEASMWLDENGKVDARPINRAGDYLAHMFSGIAPADVIVGPILVTGGTDDEGETTDLDEKWRAFLLNLPDEAKPVGWQEREPA
jgi:hypothetical protein